MRATRLLDSYLRKQCQGIHGKRMDAVFKTVEALLSARKLTVTGLGRAMRGPAQVKHNIKCADRLIGNPHLNSERAQICRATARLLIGRCRRPVIIVDWSDLSDDRELHLLRASVAVDGRALTLYEEAHYQRHNGNPRVHERFLARLKALLPQGCRPIIVTDAGFRTPWFRAVLALGWDYIGRVGGHTLVSPVGQNNWIRVEEVFATATRRARYLGPIDLVRKHPLACHAYLLKRKPKGRVKRTRFGKKTAMKHSLKNAERERSPWLLATSLPGGATSTKWVMNLYKTRMQIEEAFRDVKNTRWGFSLNEARSKIPYRYENLLLIAQLATLAVWLVGTVAQRQQWHRSYQANTVRTHRVLSTFYLGLEVARRTGVNFHRRHLHDAVRFVRHQISTAGAPS